MKDVEYILCSAIRRNVPRSESLNYHKNDLHLIEIGYRHHDILIRFKGIVSTSLKDQGFYTSKGRFVERVEAMQIAYEAGQVSLGDAKDINGNYFKLYSENLY